MFSEGRRVVETLYYRITIAVIQPSALCRHAAWRCTVVPCGTVVFKPKELVAPIAPKRDLLDVRQMLLKRCRLRRTCVALLRLRGLVRLSGRQAGFELAKERHGGVAGAEEKMSLSPSIVYVRPTAVNRAKLLRSLNLEFIRCRYRGRLDLSLDLLDIGKLMWSAACYLGE